MLSKLSLEARERGYEDLQYQHFLDVLQLHGNGVDATSFDAIAAETAKYVANGGDIARTRAAISLSALVTLLQEHSTTLGNYAGNLEAALVKHGIDLDHDPTSWITRDSLYGDLPESNHSLFTERNEFSLSGRFGVDMYYSNMAHQYRRFLLR